MSASRSSLDRQQIGTIHSGFWSFAYRAEGVKERRSPQEGHEESPAIILKYEWRILNRDSTSPASTFGPSVQVPATPSRVATRTVARARVQGPSWILTGGDVGVSRGLLRCQNLRLSPVNPGGLYCQPLRRTRERVLGSSGTGRDVWVESAI